MADYYVDPAAGGNNDGGADGAADDPTDSDNWTDAWTSVQSAFDTAVAGDSVYCRGTQTLSAKIDVDTNQGDETSGMIRFIGVEALLGNTGTRFVLDGDSAAANCLDANNIDYIHLENFELKNATSDGFNSQATCTQWVFNNCSSNNNGGYGFDFVSLNTSFMFRCTAYSNTSGGVFRGFNTKHLFCSYHDNTGSGLVIAFGASQTDFIAVLIYDNGDDGINGFSDNAMVLHSVINRNTDNGIDFHAAATDQITAIIGSRITNHSGAGDIGINCGGSILYHGWNYFEDNDGNNIQNNSLAHEILDDGATTDVEDQADTNEGYTDLTDGSEDFNLRSDATSRRTAITIPTV